MRMLTTALLCAVLTLSGSAVWAAQQIAPGQKAPTFKVTDLDGKPFDLEQAKGRVVFLDFWATWCPPCRLALPHTQALATSERAKKGELLVLAVTSETNTADVREFMAEHDYTFRAASSQDVGKQYGVTGIPTFVIIDREGVVQDSFVGFAPDQTPRRIDRAIDAAFAKPAPGGAQAAAADPAAAPTPQRVTAGDLAPPIDLTDTAGERFTLADQRGKVVVLDFWATWCGFCVQALPHTQGLADSEAAKSGDLVVLGVSVDQEPQTVTDFLTANNYTLRTVVDRAAAGAYGLRSIPAFIVVGRDGHVASVVTGWSGESTAKRLDDAVTATLAVPAS